MHALDDSPDWWPNTATSAPPSGLIVATVNYNTKALIAQLLWSLHHFLGEEVQSIVVVDNGSTDGSTELLQAMAAAGLCELIHNPHNTQHGPALSQAISHIARVYGTAGRRPWLWLLDSDCIIARDDAATSAITAANAAGAALVGESYWNRWTEIEQFGGYSLLLDPAQVWRQEVGVIPDHGDPIGQFEQAARAQGVPALSFPFAEELYLIHIGRSTLAAVHQRDEHANPHYEWAKTHHAPHFQQIPHAPRRYAELVEAFQQEVPVLRAEELVRACSKG